METGERYSIPEEERKFIHKFNWKISREET
jgi:hypothetical protein